MLHGFWILHAFFCFSSNRPFVPHSIVSNFLPAALHETSRKFLCVDLYQQVHQETPSTKPQLLFVWLFQVCKYQHATCYKTWLIFDGALCDSRTVVGHAFDPNLRTIDSFCELVLLMPSKLWRFGQRTLDPWKNIPLETHSQTLTQQFQEELGVWVCSSMIPEYEWQWVTKLWVFVDTAGQKCPSARSWKAPTVILTTWNHHATPQLTSQRTSMYLVYAAKRRKHHRFETKSEKPRSCPFSSLLLINLDRPYRKIWRLVWSEIVLSELAPRTEFTKHIKHFYIFYHDIQ